MGKSLQELTIKNNFMFAAVMLDEDNCRGLLEMILKIKIAKITVHAEKSIVYNPEYRGVRLDIEAEDETHTHYDVEMQVNRKETLLRSRYYHSQMDMELLASGKPYEELPNSYVIFICDYDPFYMKKYQYTITQKCEEVPELDVSAGIHTIFLSTQGENDDEVSKELKKFLKYVGTGLKDSEADFQDPYVKQLQNTVRKIKKDRKMGERYMVFQELLEDERKEGKKEGKKENTIDTIKEFLAEYSIILNEDEQKCLNEEPSLDRLKELLRKIRYVQTKEEFTQIMNEWKAENIRRDETHDNF